MDLGLALQILWKPATSRLNKRPLCLRFMPLPHGNKSSVPTALEFWGDFADRDGHGKSSRLQPRDLLAQSDTA
jgi:hypothetical protein